MGSWDSWDPGTVVLEIPKGFLRGQQDPRFEFPKCSRPLSAICFFSVFVVLLSKSLFGGFGGQHGLNMVPSWDPRGLQNPKKSTKKDRMLDIVFD